MDNELMLRLQYLKETGQQDEAKLFEQYLRETGQFEQPSVMMPKGPAVAADASRVAPRADGGGDLEALLGGGIKGHAKIIGNEVLPALGAHAINAAQSIPLMRNVQAGALAATSPMNYGESIDALDDVTGEIPGDLRMGMQVATGALPWTKALGAAATVGSRMAPVAKAAAKELMPRNVQRAWRVISKAKPAPKIAPKVAPVAKPAAEEVPQTLEGLLGNSMDNVAEAQKAATLESRLGLDVAKDAAQAKPWKPQRARGATKERDAYWQERIAKRQAAEAEQAEPALEDLLALSLEHIQKGGSLRQASDVASKLKLARSPK